MTNKQVGDIGHAFRRDVAGLLTEDKFKQFQLKNRQKTIIKKSIRPLKLFSREGF
jgi:hypothetical protein